MRLSLALLLLSATTRVAVTQTGFTVRDSAGVRVFESQRLGPRVRAAQQLRIGAVDGPPETTFHRIGDARFGPRGTLVVLDRGDGVIKVYDARGGHLTTFGGIGEGPAEFRSPWMVEVQGDTVRVLDITLQRIAEFGLDGAQLATRRTAFTTTQHGFPVAFTSRPDGKLFVVAVQGCGLPRRPTDNQWGLFVFGPDGTVDTLRVQFVANALAVYTDGRLLSCTVIPWPFEPGPSVAFDPGGGGYWSAGDAFEIRRFGRALNAVREVIRYTVPPRPVTAEQRRAIAEYVEARDLRRDLHQAVTEAADSAGFRDWWPAIGALHVADDGTLWAQRVTPLGGSEQEWDVLSGGRHVRTVVLPAAFRVSDVAGQGVLGVLTDELDVEYVAVFRP